MYAAINAVSGRAWPRKKPTPSSKSRSPDAIPRSSARSFFSSAIASSADCLVSSATVASDWLRQRRSDSGAIPGSFATAEIAFVSDEYEERDSASSLTAFALNSGVYRVPFAMVPSSPIELEEMRNKNQFISVRTMRLPEHC